MLPERTRPTRLLERHWPAAFRALASCVFLLAALPGRRAAADEANASCADMSESAQRAQVEHRLLQARSDFRACSQSPCTSFIRADCESALRAVEQELPTVVIAVRSDMGEEVTAARVSVDGAPTNYLRGVPIELDPGLHTFHATTLGGAHAELQIVAREGEKNRVVTLVIPSPPVKEARLTPVPAPPPAPPPPPERTAEKVLGGVGLGLVLVTVGFDIAAYSRYRSLSDSCGDTGSCSRGDVSTTATLAHTGDAVLGAGLATAAVGLIVYFARGSGAPARRTSAFAFALPLPE